MRKLLQTALVALMLVPSVGAALDFNKGFVGVVRHRWIKRPAWIVGRFFGILSGACAVI